VAARDVDRRVKRAKRIVMVIDCGGWKSAVQAKLSDGKVRCRD
jgi:hypothetical protein